jgi:predicted small secreted protein
MNRLIFFLLSFAFLLAACAPVAGPEKSVEKYFQAVNEKDASLLSTITCKAWEMDALMILDAFQAVSTELEGLSCQQTGTTADGLAVVSCSGKIIASYEGEAVEFDLSIQEYLVENANGEWLVCGTR